MVKKRLPKHLGRYLARKYLGDKSNRPVEIVAGLAEPSYVGERAHHTTRGGEPIAYPSAYSRKGWSNMIYHRSTLRIIVGSWWISQAAKTWLAV
jgi:hypothetical protein